MNTKEITLSTINSLLDFDKDSSSALLYGITKVGETLDFKIIASSPDVYEMIDDALMDQTYFNYNYAVLKTTGWAAPLNANGEVEGMPSQHPERRRVRLFVVADIDNNEVTGSALTFEDEPNDPVFDLNQATGSLADAVSQLLR